MTWENSAITIATFLPVLGALVIALVPRDKETAVRALGIVFTGAALVVAIAIAVDFDYGAARACSSSWTPAGSRRSPRGTTWASTASACPLYVLTFAALVPVRHLHLALRPEPGQDEGVPRR